MWKPGNWAVAGIILIGIAISLYSFDVILSTDKQRAAGAVLNSLHQFVAGGADRPGCSGNERNRNGTEEKPCNCSNPTSNLNPSSNPSPAFWYAEGKLWHYPTVFPRCSMDACFNFSRCENMDDIRIFSYYAHSRYLSLLNSSRWATADPQRACLFLVNLDVPNPWAPHPRQVPYWNGGLNHVLVTFTDRWGIKRIPEGSIGFASLAITDMHQTVYRPGFDLSIPLPPRHRLERLQGAKPFSRKYFLTFKGLRYLGRHMEGAFRSHESFRKMHNGADVVVAVSCRHPTNNRIRQSDPALGAGCDEDQAVYGRYSYEDLMNSTFALAPAGRQPNSYRFSEILSAGSIPVLVADNYVKPFETLVQWHRCILEFPTSEMHRIVPVLRRIGREEAERRQEYCLQVYNSVFKDDETLVGALVLSLKARMMGFFPNVTSRRTVA